MHEQYRRSNSSATAPCVSWPTPFSCLLEGPDTTALLIKRKLAARAHHQYLAELCRAAAGVGLYGYHSATNATEGAFRPQAGHRERRALEHFAHGMVWSFLPQARHDLTGPSRH
jgi:hypothetical protein